MKDEPDRKSEADAVETARSNVSATAAHSPPQFMLHPSDFILCHEEPAHPSLSQSSPLSTARKRATAFSGDGTENR
jgi:hypothetical protein